MEESRQAGRLDAITESGKEGGGRRDEGFFGRRTKVRRHDSSRFDSPSCRYRLHSVVQEPVNIWKRPGPALGHKCLDLDCVVEGASRVRILRPKVPRVANKKSFHIKFIKFILNLNTHWIYMECALLRHIYPWLIPL